MQEVDVFLIIITTKFGDKNPAIDVNPDRGRNAYYEQCAYRCGVSMATKRKQP